MTVEYKKTPEEEAYDQLLDEQWESLSDAVRVVLEKAMSAAYRAHMIASVMLDPRDYIEIMEKMQLAAAGFTDHDCEQLTKIWRAALAAAASVEPYDYETIVGYRAYPAHLHRFYRMVSSMVEEVEWEKRYAEFQKKELAEQKPIDYDNIPF